MIKLQHLLVLALLLVLASCAQRRAPDKGTYGTEKIYKGILTVDADPGLEHVMSYQKEIFEYLYDSVKLNIRYRNEPEMLEDFRTGRATVLVMTRALDSIEKQNLIDRDTLYVRELQVAYDAVALVANNSFNDSTLNIEMLKGYFAPGNDTTNTPKMVFEDQHSSVVKFVLNKLGYKEKVSSHVYALKSTQEVIEYVKKDKNAIGFVPFNFLSDFADERVKKLYDSIKVISLHFKDKDGSIVRTSANQSDIALGEYPLLRNIVTETRFSYDDNLELLFINYLYKERGARIFMRDGLMPMHIPPLDINVNTEGLKGQD